MTKIVFFSDNDVTDDAKDVNAAMVQENADAYCFVGDGPYRKEGVTWTDQQKVHFDDKKDKMIWSRGNHDEDESESKQTQEDMEAWFPEAKSLGIADTWLISKQVGNVYIISMDSQDMDVEFKRDQFNWVVAEMAKAKQLRASGQIDWIVALFHKPAFTLKSSHSPYTAVRFLYKDVFKDELDFWVHGHNHNTQLWKPMVPDDSEANGTGQQLFTQLPDGTIDFSKPHGWIGVITGHAGHEWNKIDDSGDGVNNVFHFRDSGKFGYTVLETNGKSAKILSKDTDNTTTFEYPPITREGSTTHPPPECTDPTKCIDSQTGECRTIGANEHKSPTNGLCMSNPPTGQIICPRDYHYDQSLDRCIPDLEPDLPPQCPAGTKWNGKFCVPTGGTQPPPNQPPVADAGSDKTVAPQTTVTLNGTKSSDPEGTILSAFTWKQISGGPVVSLTNSNTLIASFVAPNEETVLDFQLEVTDDRGLKDTDTVKITVKSDAPPECPVGQHRDPTTGQCVPDDTGPSGDVLWDSNVHLKTGEAYTITDTHGSQAPDGKGVFMAASGDPRVHVDPDGTFHLEADAGHGRMYIKARNYNARMEGELMFEDNKIRNTTLRLRSRHNMGGACDNRFGGFGATVEREEQLAEFATEPCHNIHSNTKKVPLDKDIEVGTWIKFKYSVWSNADKSAINQKLEYDYNDGQGFKTVVEASFDNVEPYMMDEADFAEESYAWLRVNNESTGKVAYRNIRIVKI